MAIDDLALFTGNANPELAGEVSAKLGVGMGRALVSEFSDGEVNVEIMENVRGADVYVLQPTCAPASKHLMELLVMIDALRRSSAERITAVMPYFGYARQDRRPRTARVAITAKLVADMINIAVPTGSSRWTCTDQIQGFRLFRSTIFMRAPCSMESCGGTSPIISWWSPDVGGVVRASAMAKQLGGAIIDKRRPRANEAKVMHIIGSVDQRSCVLMDDMVDTANTLCQAASALKDAGAVQVKACCTHPVLSGQAIERIEASELDEVVVTNSIPLSDEARKHSTKILQISVASLLAV